MRNTYSGNVLTAQVYPNGNIYRYQYVWSANKRYVVKVTITMPDGSKREHMPRPVQNRSHQGTRVIVVARLAGRMDDIGQSDDLKMLILPNLGTNCLKKNK